MYIIYIYIYIKYLFKNGKLEMWGEIKKNYIDKIKKMYLKFRIKTNIVILS